METDFSLAEWMGEHTSSWWIFYDDETITAWVEDGRIWYEI